MKKNIKLIKLLVIILLFVMSFSLFKNKYSYGVYRQSLRTTVSLTVLDPSTTYTVSFEPGNGTMIDDTPLLKTYNELLGTPEEPTLAHYNFVGWYTDSGFQHQAKPDMHVTSDLTLYAKYTKIVCEKATSLHQEKCEQTTGNGCIAAGIGSGLYFDYGELPDGDFNSGEAYNCDVNNDDYFDPVHERFYLLRQVEANDSMALIYYTNIDENGIVDTSVAQGGSYTYEIAMPYLPQTNVLSSADQWDNPALLTFTNLGYSNRVSRLLTVDDLEVACGTFSTSAGYMDNCYFILENTRFQSGSKGRAGIWMQASAISSNGGQRIHSSTRQVSTVDSTAASGASNNATRPVIEVPVDSVEGFPVRYQYEARFDAQNGTEPTTITRYVGQKLGSIVEPVRTGFDFVGWYTDNINYTTEIDEDTLMPNYDVTYYAKWEAIVDNLEYVFRIQGTCVFNGGPDTQNNLDNYITSPNNSCISVDKNNNQINWATANVNYIDTGIALFNSANYQKDFEVGFTIDSYDGAHQSENQVTFFNSKLDNQSLNYPGMVFRRNNSNTYVYLQERFESNDNVSQAFTYHDGIKIRIVRRNDRIWYAEGNDELTELQNISSFNKFFELYAWFGAYALETSTSANGTNSTVGRYIKATMSNLYIKLEIDNFNSHEVNFITEGGTLNMNSTRYVVDGAQIGELPTVTRPHYTFDGWYLQNGSTPITSSYIVTADTNLYAHFTPDTQEVTFDSDGGVPASYTYYVDFNEMLGQANIPSSNPTKSHYTFGGWYTDNTWTEQVTAQTIVTGDVTFIAMWIPDQHTITFDSDGGVPATYTATVNYGEMIGQANMPTPNPTKTDMTFSGWYTDNQNYTTQVTANTVVYGNTTYYAKWTQGSSLTVTFNVQDGDPITPNPWYYSYGDLLDNLPTPTRQYFQFVNWYSDSDLTQLVDATTAIYTDMELYAKWELDPAYVARIGNTYYTTLALAINAASSSSQTTITMVQDHVMANTISIASPYDIILDLNGNDVEYTSNTGFEIQNGASLTIRDTTGGGTLDAGSVISNKQKPGIVNSAGGSLYIESGHVTSTNTNVIENSGYMSVTGGSITIGNVTQGIINNYVGGVLDVSGGEIVASVAGSKRQAIYNEKGTVNISGNAYLYSNSTDRATVQNANTGGIINITGGTIISANSNCQRGAIQNASGSTVNLISGTVISNSTYTGSNSGYGPGGIQNEGTLVIGDDSDGVYDLSTPVIQAKKFGINLVNGTNASNVYMYDGIIKSVGQTIKNNYTIPSANTMSGTSEVTGETEEIDNLTYNLFYYELISGYTVTFDAGSGQAEKASMKFPENATVSNLPTATWAGHIFDGWYTPQNQLVVEGVTVVDQDITYTAHWLNSVEQANMTNSSMTLTLNGTESIGVTNANSIESFTYSSNDPTVATVNSSGVVTAVGPGKTQIALTGDRSGDIVHALVTVNYSNDIQTFDIMPTAMRTYFNNIDIWAKDQTDASHTSYDNYMSTNLSTNNCVNFGGTGGDDRSNKGLSSGSTFCDVPNQYDTGVTGNLNVYEYNPTTNTNVADATYVTVNNGKIYNVIPGKAYYWESVSDSTVNGKFYAYGERRIIQIDNLKSGSSDTYYQTRNVRDLGGIPVEYVNASNQTVTGTIKYEKLYRGEKIWGGSGASLQYFTKLGINHEMDLRGNSEPVSGEEDSFADAYKIRSASKTYEIIHYGIDYTANSSNYNLARGALVEVMNAFINDPNYSLYFHCRIGADRTGTLAYLLEGLLGASNEDMYRDYEMTVFFGLDERTRFYYNKGDNTTKFVYMKQAIRNASQSGTDEDVLQWFLKGSSNQAADMTLIQNFRSAMVDISSVN